MAVTLRSGALGVITGAAAAATLLAAITVAPATANAASLSTSARVTVSGTVPAWARTATRVGAVNPGALRRVQIALAPRDPAGARALATAIATPGNPQYRHPLSQAAYMQRFGPAAGTVRAVQAWLRGQGLRVTGVSAGGELVDAVGSVARVQAAFGTHLSVYRASMHGQTRLLVAPDSDLSTPATLGTAVTAVLGLDDSGQAIAPAQSRVPVPAAAANGTRCAPSWDAVENTAVPQRYPAGQQSNALCGYHYAAIRAAYGLTAADTGQAVTVGIVGAYNDDAIISDTNHAATDFGAPQLGSGQYQSVLPSGGFVDNPNCTAQVIDTWHGEQALDVQSVHTTAPAANLIYYAAADCTSLPAAFMQAVSADQASILTDSWAFTGEANVPPAEKTVLENAAVQAAVQGITVLFSTGDFGDDSTATGSVQANFPPSDPWVTAVGGATVGLDAADHTVVETGWADTGNIQNGSAWQALPPTQGGFAGGTGGGVSSLYPTPGYQSGLPAAVTNGHRALPDVAGLADPYTGMAVGYTSAANGFVELPFGGTSEASPQVAGLVADAGQRVGSGGWLGLINPAVYGLGATALTDVTAQHAGVWTPFQPTQISTTGSFLVDLGANPQSLAAGPGWDDETGMGLPNTGFVTALAAAATG